MANDKPKKKYNYTKKTGRPSTYTQEVGDEICKRLATGEPLAQILRSPGMPSSDAVWDWRKAHPNFGSAVARARKEGYDAIAADALAISDDLTDDPNSRRVRLDARRWLLARWDPKRYGDRVELEHSGDVGLQITIGSDVGSGR